MDKKKTLLWLFILLASSLGIASASTNPFSDSSITVFGSSSKKISDTAKVETKDDKTDPKTAPAATKKSSEYRVAKGDYLMAIARKFYNGDSSRWTDLVEANKDRYPSLLSNPNLIYVGWVLTIPDVDSNKAASNSSSSGNSSSSVSSNSNKVGSGNAPKYSNDNSSGAPSLKNQKAPSGSGINSKSPDFKTWMSNAVSTYGDWDMPAVTNRYGQTISVEMYMKAIMYIESSGTHRKSDGSLVKSYCGAQGFMQLMPNTAAGLGVDGTDPAQNISGGCKLFKQIFTSKYVGQKSGIEKMVLAACAYNCGPWSKRVRGTWEDLKNSGSSVAGYGIKFKMCVGLELTADEKNYVKSKMSGGKSVEQYAAECYAYAQGLGI